MQVLGPFNPTGLNRATWKRKRTNHDLLRKVAAPLDAARAAGHDPWWWDGSRWQYDTNPVWEAALLEYNLRFQAYMELRPF